MKYNNSMEYFTITDIGKIREKNEDSLYADKNLFIVADGMGGHMAGEIASRLAIESFTDFFFKRLKKESDTDSPDKFIMKNILKESFAFANRQVFDRSIRNYSFSGMGTTFTGCYLCEEDAVVVHLGDSRLYLHRERDLILCTDDHNIVGELYRSGKISYRQTFNHPQRNFLTRVLGISEDIEPDLFSKRLMPGDILLLCSDGLNSLLKDNQIAQILEKNKEDIKKAAKMLVTKTLKKGGFDNVTIIVIKI